MKTAYAKKNESFQKKKDCITSVFDNSSQSKSLQRKADMANNAVQRDDAPRPNNTGMPDNLKSGIESLSGFSMDNVRVYFNSSKPATVQALAYTQGTDIHVAPGQEKCLPHEAWHVAQQMAGRVSPTTNINGMPVNDNAALEHEADVMGEKAVQCKSKTADAKKSVPLDGMDIQRKGKYDGVKKKVIDVFCESWKDIYVHLREERYRLNGDLETILFIGQFPICLAEEKSTHYDITNERMVINKNDLNGNSGALFQKCLHELGHYVDLCGCQSYAIAENKKRDDAANKMTNPNLKGKDLDNMKDQVDNFAKEMYADLFAFSVRLEKEKPNSSAVLVNMIESVDLSGRPKTWIEVPIYPRWYPPAEYTRSEMIRIGLYYLKSVGKYEPIKLFDENFPKYLNKIYKDITAHKVVLNKGKTLGAIVKWHNKKFAVDPIQYISGLLELSGLNENDVPEFYKKSWNAWVNRSDVESA